MVKQIKVVHIVKKPQIGGSEMLVRNIINAELNDIVSHYMLYAAEGSLLNIINESKQSKLIYCRYGNPVLFIFFLRRIIKQIRPEIIHTHQPIDVIYSLFASIGLGVKIIRTYHGYEGINRRKQGFSFRRRVIYSLINRFVCLNLFVSNDLLKYYRKINKRQSALSQRVLYNGVNIDEITAGAKSNIRQELGLPANQVLLGMVGGFSTRGRDHLTICKAMKLAVATYPGLSFVFIGRTSGKYPELFNNCLNYCEKHGLKKNVHFMGERNNVRGLLKELDLYVHSSNNETFGIALVEAMLAGIPCLVSDIGPFREVSGDGKFVAMFEKGNAEDLHKHIMVELSNLDSQQTRERKRNAMEFANNNFSIRVHMTNLHKMYLECIK